MVMVGFNPPPSTTQPLPMIVPGTLAVAAGNILIPAMASYQILGVQATLGTPAVGSPVIADILVNGVSVYTTLANRPTISAGVNSSSVTVPDFTTVTQGSLISVNVVQVGSTSPGANLCVMVMMKAVSAF